MADLIDLHLRCAPWKPSPDSETVAEYRYYDVPLVGVVRQGDREFLFKCLDGADETISLWWYVHITSEQRAELESSDAGQFDETLRNLPFSGWSRLAFATTNLGIVDSEDADIDSDDGFQTARDALTGRLEQLSADANQLEASR